MSLPIQFAQSVNALADANIKHLKRERARVDDLSKLLDRLDKKESLDLDLERCSFCNHLFEFYDEYEWECALAESRCSLWCGRDWCTSGKDDMVPCARCNFGVCKDCQKRVKLDGHITVPANELNDHIDPSFEIICRNCCPSTCL